MQLQEKEIHAVKDGKNILEITERRMSNWIGHVLHNNCLPKHVIDGKIRNKIVRRGRRKQLLEDFGKRVGTRN